MAQNRHDHDPVEPLRRDAPELAMLFDALRSEFDAKLANAKLWGGLAMLGGGAVGGMAAEMIRPGTAQAVAQAAVGWML